MQKYMQRDELTADEIRYLDLTSKLNEVFLDKRFYQKMANTLSSEVIMRLESDLIDQILGNYYEIKRFVEQHRNQWLNSKQKEKKGKILKKKYLTNLLVFEKTFVKFEEKLAFKNWLKKNVLVAKKREEELIKNTQIFCQKKDVRIKDMRQYLQAKEDHNGLQLGGGGGFFFEKKVSKRKKNQQKIKNFFERNIPKYLRSELYGKILEKDLIRKVHPNSKILLTNTENFVRDNKAEKKKLLKNMRKYRVRSRDPGEGSKIRFKTMYSMGPNRKMQMLDMKDKSKKNSLLKKIQRVKAVKIIQRYVKGFLARRRVSKLKYNVDEYFRTFRISKQPERQQDGRGRARASPEKKHFNEMKKLYKGLFNIFEGQDGSKRTKRAHNGGRGEGDGSSRRNLNKSQKFMSVSRSRLGSLRDVRGRSRSPQKSSKFIKIRKSEKNNFRGKSGRFLSVNPKGRNRSTNQSSGKNSTSAHQNKKKSDLTAKSQSPKNPFASLFNMGKNQSKKQSEKSNKPQKNLFNQTSDSENKNFIIKVPTNEPSPTPSKDANFRKFRSNGDGRPNQSNAFKKTRKKTKVDKDHAKKMDSLFRGMYTLFKKHDDELEGVGGTAELFSKSYTSQGSQGKAKSVSKAEKRRKKLEDQWDLRRSKKINKVSKAPLKDLELEQKFELKQFTFNSRTKQRHLRKVADLIKAAKGDQFQRFFNKGYIITSKLVDSKDEVKTLIKLYPDIFALSLLSSF